MVAGPNITVNLATDGAGNPTQNFAQVAALMNADPATAALVVSIPGPNATLGIFPFGPSALSGGSGPAGAEVFQNDLQLLTDSDAPFRLTGVVVWALSATLSQASTVKLAIRFTRPDGSLIQKIMTSTNLLFPGNRYTGFANALPNFAMVCPIYPNVLYPPNTNIRVDVLGLPQTILSPPSPGFRLIFCGTKIFKPGSVWAPTYPAKWKPRPYTDSLTLSNVDVTLLPILGQPFTAQPDADFVMQLGKYTDNTAGGGVAGGTVMQLPDLGVRIKDSFEKYFDNDYIPVSLLFPFMNNEAAGFPLS